MMKTFPKLYKKTSTGAIQEWSICAYQESMNSKDATIEITYGQLDSDKIQTTTDVISSGKNVGKKNATTPFEQAVAEAQSKWEKQKKKGYVETIKGAEKGELDDLIEGGVVPMLAHKFTEHAHKIKYPAYVQPKLDGIRCIAILKGGECTLWSRTRKQITSVPHIVAEIEKQFPKDVILDGELYNHDLKANFEKIVSMVRQEVPTKGHEIVQYHVYDVFQAGDFSARTSWLKSAFERYNLGEGALRFVLTTKVSSEDEVMDHFNLCRHIGYEGCMLRNSSGLYVNKRSYDLQKVKEFDDNEFPIVGFEEGRGKLAGHVGSFLCKTSSGKEFFAKMRGDTSTLRDYFLDHSLWTGKMLSVQYQGLTGKESVPRFPVGIAIRDYE